MVYYHIGRVLEVLNPRKKDVLSADTSVQAVVETWDENIITFDVAKKLARKLKEGDVVLLDYTPLSEKIVMPKMKIVKILRGELAKKVWDIYKEFYSKRPRRKTTQQVTQAKPEQPQLRYLG